MKILTAMLLMAAATPVAAGEWIPMPPDNMPVYGLAPVLKSQTQLLEQMPFDHPSWEPNEETKKRALRRAYELNGNKMVGTMIDVSQDPEVTGHNLITPETEFNVLDSAAPNVAAPDVCKRHGMHKVTSADGTSWRCRK